MYGKVCVLKKWLEESCFWSTLTGKCVVQSTQCKTVGASEVLLQLMHLRMMCLLFITYLNELYCM